MGLPPTLLHKKDRNLTAKATPSKMESTYKLTTRVKYETEVYISGSMYIRIRRMPH